ncbi:MAG TPA: hybrid sensor histidine kinase/response regulator, partial [Chloroflexi bacterium]|nr:hybrid sensor histidine kinase/response regulator [Chloroflexota bacterium]
LSRAGHQVVVAATGEDGWQQIQSGQFDLVLLDIMMPDINGMELLRRIVPFDPDLVCIIITGYATVELAVQAIKGGAYDFISKPFDANALLMTVRRGLERRHLSLETRRLAQIEAEKEALERRKAELEREALAQRALELERLDRVKSAFTRTVAHELRAPTAAIQSYLRLVLAGYIPPEQQREYLVRAEQRTSAQLELISDLLHLAHLQNPDLRIEREPVNVAESLREVCDLMSSHAQEKGIEFTVSVPEERYTILADPKHIKQLWSNLVSNAIKYTDEGGAVNVTMTVQDKQVVISVCDNGIGIAPEDLPRIFEEFYRTKAAKEYSEMGTGLGLSIVKRIVETYQGHIDVQSAVGQGSTFTVALPIDT